MPNKPKPAAMVRALILFTLPALCLFLIPQASLALDAEPSTDYIMKSSEIMLGTADEIFKRISLKKEVPRALKIVMENLGNQLEKAKDQIDAALKKKNDLVKQKSLEATRVVVKNMIRLMRSLGRLMDGNKDPETRKAFLEIRQDIKDNLMRLKRAVKDEN